MIKRYSNWNNVKAYKGFEQLPKGGYVVKILGVEICNGDKCKYAKLMCDIAEGDYNGFFLTDYRSQQGEDKWWRCIYYQNLPNDDGTKEDEKRARWFRTFTDALEDSNPGYHFDWDEQKFKGKLIGGLFITKEYIDKKDNTTIRNTTKFKSVCTVDEIRSGNYRLPNDELLNSGVPSPSNDGFMNIPDGIDEELPFK